jgi:KDO2-lipid IV(A) lauroyltransferase
MAGRIADALTGLVAAVAVGAVSLLPMRTASNLGGFLARSVGPRLRATRTARRNLRAAFPEWTDARIDETVRAVWDNFGRTAFEFPHLAKLRFDGPDPDIEVIGAEIIHRARDDGEPGLFFSGHLANWEVLAVTALAHGVDLDLVYRAPNNPAVERLFRSRHLGEGELIPKGPKGARRVLARLAEGHHLGLLVDQKMNDGIAVPFFGRAAMTAPALAQLGLRSGCPVIPARIERLGPARFRVTVCEPIAFETKGSRAETTLAAMTQVNALLETWIRERPGEWLWIHNRWPD